MLNANTTTSIFRENTFDIQAFLITMYQMNIEDSIRIIESKWADGSIDQVPTVALVKSIVYSLFMQLYLGGFTLKPNDDGSLEISGDAGLRGVFDSVGDSDSDITFDACVIPELEADNVSITGQDAEIELADKTMDVNVRTLLVTGTLKCTNMRYTAVTINGRFDAYKICLDCPIKVVDAQSSSSQLLSYCSNVLPGIKNSIVLTGPLCLADHSDTGESLRTTFKDRFTKYPLGFVSVPYVSGVGYTRTDGQSFAANGIDTAIDPKSYLGMLCLYPKISGSYRYNIDSATFYDCYTFFMERLDESDNNTVISVHNISDSSITACNAWNIYTPTDMVVPTITAANYIVIPPYSKIDFLLIYNEYPVTQTRVVMMLPMKHLDTALAQ